MFGLQTDDRNERKSADTDAKEEPEDTAQQGDKQEYEAMEIPEHWLPLPIFLVSLHVLFLGLQPLFMFILAQMQGTEASISAEEGILEA